MNILFDPTNATDLAELEKRTARIDEAMRDHFVWAKIRGFGGRKYLVRDVRVLEEVEQYDEERQIAICSERLQVLLLEGWRTAKLVWTDEEVVDEVEGVQ